MLSVSWTAIALLHVLAVDDSSPELRPGVKLEAGGVVIDERVGHFVPCALDWNGDGKKDLLVGQFSGGKIRLYLNRGSDAAPRFADFSYLEAGGKQISLPSG